ncbi:hypothetical protein ACB098_01G210100 [Castanea mollissima]
MANEEKLHIAIFPWLAYGQVMPYFELSKFLAQKGHKVFFISSPSPPKLVNLSLINLVELPLPYIDGLPRAAESTSELSNHQVPYLKKKAYEMLEARAPSDSNSPELGSLNASVLAFFGPPSEMTNVYRKSLEDFTVSPKWIDFPCDVAYNVPELLSHRVCMDMNMSDLTRAATFEADALSLLEKLYQKPVVPIGLLPPSVQR